MYQNLLMNDIDIVTLSTTIPDRDDITSTYMKLCNSKSDCANDVFPKKANKRHLKPYWNDTLNDLHDKMWYYCTQWRKSGRPRDKNSFVFREYKYAKRTFRREHRRTVNNYFREVDRQLELKARTDSVGFLKEINTRKQNATVSSGMGIEFNDRMYRDRESLTEQWKCYFRSLYSPAESELFDNTWRYFVEQYVNGYFDNVTPDLECSVTSDTVSYAIQTLPKGKSPGDDLIRYEHLLFADRFMFHYTGNYTLSFIFSGAVFIISGLLLGLSKVYEIIYMKEDRKIQKTNIKINTLKTNLKK
ncbi:hypothetical protein ACF0H5_023637 [Mactra antiquata]